MDASRASPAPREILDPEDPRLDGWYHTIDLGAGIVTRGVFDHRSVFDRFGFPESLAGKNVLDVGTGDGFFAFEFERRGADRVVAVDVPTLGELDWVPSMRTRLGAAAAWTSPWAARFQLAHATLGSRVEYRHCSVYDLSPETLGSFDLVFCGSLLLHLKSPLVALERIRSVTDGVAIVETAISPELEERLPDAPAVWFGAFAEAETGSENTHWLLTTTALERMLLSAGFPRTERRGVFDLAPGGPTVTVVVANSA